MKQVTYEGLTFEPYISKQDIQARIEVLGKEITRDCAGKMPLFVCVLNGAFPFASDLFRAVEDADAEITFIRLKSYEGTSSSGAVKEVVGLHEDIEGRRIVPSAPQTAQYDGELFHAEELNAKLISGQLLMYRG